MENFKRLGASGGRGLIIIIFISERTVSAVGLAYGSCFDCVPIGLSYRLVWLIVCLQRVSQVHY